MARFVPTHWHVESGSEKRVFLLDDEEGLRRFSHGRNTVRWSCADAACLGQIAADLGGA